MTYNKCATYFVRAADGTGPVKIGFSISPMSRLCELRYKRKCALQTLALIPGNYEARFHQLFRDWHEGGEWFTWSDELGRVVDQIAAGTFDFGALPAGKRITGAGAHYKTHIGCKSAPAA